MNLSIPGKRYHAFTLIELMVGMIVSGIVLAAALSFLRIISLKVKAGEENKIQAEEMSFFYRTIYSDFKLATGVVKNNEEVEMNSKESSVLYNFERDYITRKSESGSDTFHVTHSIPEMTYDVNAAEILSLQLHLQYNGITQEIFLTRSSDAGTKLTSDD
jgi:prepilin-type N-terminal cleavage/methylation domain-containing protein